MVFILCALVLGFSYVSIPVNQVSASNEQIVQTISEDGILIDKATRLGEILEFSSDFTKIYFDINKAKQIGLTEQEIINVKEGFKSFTFDEVEKFIELTHSSEIIKEKIFYAIPLAVLVRALIIAGLTWLAKELLNLGVYLACGKWKYKYWLFTAYCNSKGY